MDYPNDMELRDGDSLEFTVQISDGQPVTLQSMRKLVRRVRTGQTPLFATTDSAPVMTELHKLWGTARRPARPPK
jgi:hypothetical protein